MPRPKKGEPGFAEAIARWRLTMEKKYGGAEALHKKMQERGRRGGKAGHTGGLYGCPEKAREAGRIGGRVSRKGKKYLGIIDGKMTWEDKSTGKKEAMTKAEYEQQLARRWGKRGNNR